jgi:5-methyltetrahydrofolate--homocysteine methyltransferase
MAVKEIYQAVLDFDNNKIVNLVNEEIASGTKVDSILNDGLIAAMDEVGKRFSQNEFFVPEMLVAAQTMEAGLNELKKHISKADVKNRGTIVMGTVKGDLHDIGKNLVCMMLEGAGYEIIDLGVNVEAEKFVSASKENKADIVGLSALLTTTMPAMAEAINALREEDVKVKIMVGGAPVTQEFADSIGADGYSNDAPAAVLTAHHLING